MAQAAIRRSTQKPGRYGRKTKRILTDVLMYTVLIGISAFMMMPFLWMLSTSFKPESEVFTTTPTLFSPNSSLFAYRHLIFEQHILRNVWNSFLVAVLATLLSLLFCSLGGYGFAKYKFKGRGVLFGLLLGTLVIPPAVGMVPQYIIFLKLGWIDSYWGLIIPGAANAFGIFFMRQYISSINNELLDAGRVDGATEIGLYWRIVLPIIKPGLISLGLIFFMASWNSYLWPLVLLKSPENFTLPLMIRMQVHGLTGMTAFPYQMAASVISIVPLLIIFIVFQRRFVEGITSGAIK